MTDIIAPYINIHTHKQAESEVTIACVGIHPYMAESGLKLTKESITAGIEAIGEIGLDYSRSINKSTQIELFKEQLLIAEELSLPVVIHAVRAVDDVIGIIKQFSLPAAIFHGFIGSTQQAKKATDSGYFLSFGHRCFTSPKTMLTLRSAPLANIFFETDDEDIPIEEIYTRGAQQREENIDQIREQLYINYKRIFNK